MNTQPVQSLLLSFPARDQREKPATVTRDEAGKITVKAEFLYPCELDLVNAINRMVTRFQRGERIE